MRSPEEIRPVLLHKLASASASYCWRAEGARPSNLLVLSALSEVGVVKRLPRSRVSPTHQQPQVS